MPGAKPHDRRESRLNRRTVLLGTIAAAQLPMVQGAEAQGPRASQSPPDPRQPLYRETEHIRTFYDRSRF
jgi:hypothetical protein